MEAMLAAGHGGWVVGIIVVGFLALAGYSLWYMFFKVGK